MKNKIFYIETGLGCCLIKTKTAEMARKEALASAGSFAGVQTVREATLQDIAWVNAMQKGK